MGSFLLVFPSDSDIASLSRSLYRAGGAVENVVGGAAATAATAREPGPAVPRVQEREDALR